MRHLHLILQTRQDLHAGALASIPSLGRLRRRGRPLPAPACLSEACCLALGIARQQDWPIAPLAARAAGLEVGEAYWLRLDPVHLDVGMQGLFLRGGLALDEHERAAIYEVVLPILAQAGLDAFSGPDGNLLVRCGTPPRLTTTPLDQVEGRQPTRYLPAGIDAPFWTRLLHELQMALHEHPANLARMAARKPPVNSFWPWGGGRFVPPAGEVGDIRGALPLLGQLAAALDIPLHPPPAGLGDLLGARASRGLVVLEVGTPEALTRDIHGAWDQAWFRPLSSALRWGRLASAQVSILGAEGESWALTPLDLWRIRV